VTMKIFITCILLFICFLFINVGNVWAEIRTYTLDHQEVIDKANVMKIDNLPILAGEKMDKRIYPELIIAGLGTNHITASCNDIYSLISGTNREIQIYPMDKNDGSGADVGDWYYVTYSQGVTIIQINGEIVKVHVLGKFPMTYVGKRNN